MALIACIPMVLLVIWLRPSLRIPGCLLVGYLWSLLFAHNYLHQVLPDSDSGNDFLVTGYVDGIPDADGHSVRFNFRVKEFLPKQTAKSVDSSPAAGKLRLSWYYSPHTLISGEEWQLLVRLKTPHGMQNPGGFDYEKWLYTESIHATGYVRKAKENLLLSESSASVDKMRQSLQKLIYAVPNTAYHGIIEALTTGHRARIDSDQWQLLLDTGTSHLMAISGLHIGLVAGLVFWGVRKILPAFLLKYFTAQQYAAVISLCVAGFYATLAGFSVPTQRAFVMLLVVMLALLLRRPAFGINTLSLALIAVLVINPVSVISPGFWLSFLAVLIIGLLVTGRQRQGKYLYRWLDGVRIQWMIAVGMLPLTLVLFQQASIISPIANMLVIPLIGLLVVPLALLASLISMVSPSAGVFLFTFVSELINFIWILLQYLAASPISSLYIPGLSLITSLLALVGGGLLLMPAGFPARYAGLVLLLPLIFVKPPRPGNGEIWLHILDVGQGLAILIQTQHHDLLYDSGDRFSERFDIGQRVVIPYLRYLGVQKLDLFIISHADRDHSGGASAILQNIPVRQLMGDTSMLQADSLQMGFASCSRGTRWDWDGVEFRILHPDTDYKRSNNRSCVLSVNSGQSSLLIPGDIERKVERHLLQASGIKLDVDVLILAHHGSNTSTTEAWLERLKPSLAVASAGYRNRFGHPANKVRQRLQNRGVKLLNTANSGAIRIRMTPDRGATETKIRTHRKDTVHYWNHRF